MDVDKACDIKSASTTRTARDTRHLLHAQGVDMARRSALTLDRQPKGICLTTGPGGETIASTETSLLSRAVLTLIGTALLTACVCRTHDTERRCRG